MDIYQDLSLDEESKIPLPENWIRTMKASLRHGNNDDDSNIVVYQDLKSGLETEEHPIISKALHTVRLIS